MRVNLACKIVSNSLAMDIEKLCIINNDLGEFLKFFITFLIYLIMII